MMDIKLIKQNVNQILMELAPLDEITPQLSLRDDLGIDSLGLATLMFRVEEVFGITLETSHLDPERFVMVQDVYLLMEQYCVRE